MYTKLFLFILFTSSLTIIAYNRFAWQRGWQVGKLFESDNNLIKIVAMLSMITAFVTAFFFATWYFVLIAAFVSWFAGTIITAMFRSSTQILAIVLWLASYIFLLYDLF
jgi:hypothetical protein